jgi:hypothetical protein
MRAGAYRGPGDKYLDIYMKRPDKIRSGPNKGKYMIKNKLYSELFGSRRKVFNGTAYKTRGNLTKDDLFFNKMTDRVVSKKKHFWAIKHKPLKKAGWTAKKGKFGAVKIGSTKRGRELRWATTRRNRGRGSRKMRGGSNVSDSAKFESAPATVASSYGADNVAYNVK